LRLDQLVAHAPHGLDLRRGAAQLVAQPGDVDIYRAGVAEEVRAPDELAEALARKYHAGTAGQHGEQVELLRPQLHAPPRPGHFVAVRVDAQVTDLERPLARAHARGAAQHGLHARRQLARIEGLGDVVVRAQLQARHAVLGLVARGEHDDRHVALLAELAAHL